MSKQKTFETFVQINDPSDFYYKRIGTIAGTEVFGDVIVHTVHIPSRTGNAVISGAFRDEKLLRVA